MSIGEKLKELREKNGYTKKDVSISLEMPYTTYNNYETDAREAGSKTLKKIAKLYNVTIDYILGVELPNDEIREMNNNPQLKELFDVAKESSKENVKLATKMLKQMRRE